MKYFLAVLGIILVGIVAIVLLVSGNPSTKPTGKASDLTNYDKSQATLRLTIDGRETGVEQHRAVRITVDRRVRQIAVLTGYEGQIIREQTYDNQDEAFAVFLRALQYADFTKENKNAIPKDERGVCPTGQRYIYELIDNAKSVLRTWNTSCSGGKGSFTGKGPQVRQLFQMQIPDYLKQTNNVSL